MTDSPKDANRKVRVLRPRDAEFNASLLRAIQEASLDGILVVDENAVVVSCNERFLEIWQVPESAFAQSGDDEAGPSEDSLLPTALAQLKNPDAFVERVAHLYRNPNLVDHAELTLKDNRTLERYSTGLFNDEHKYLGRVWFFRDITERKEREQVLRDRARRDSLTRLLNRGRFLELAAVEIERVKRYQRSLSVIMLDLDHFKDVNDTHGHAAGDHVLQQLAERWQAALRNVDLLGRTGGEEFSVLLPDTDCAAARAVAERLREATMEDPIKFEGRSIDCSVSAGIADLRASDECVDEALRRADAAMYRAKQNGRNRVEVAEP